MRPEFMAAIPGAEHRYIEHAARLERQAFSTPFSPPTIFRDELLDRTIEVVRRRPGSFDAFGAERLFPILESFVEHALFHQMQS
jgi:hypothetical protein